MDIEQTLKAQLEATKQELSSVYSSISWRLGTRIVSALRIPLRLLGVSGGAASLPIVEINQWSPAVSGVVRFGDTNQDSVHLVLSVEDVDVRDQTIYRDISRGFVSFEMPYPLSMKIQRHTSIKLRHSGRGPSLTRDLDCEIPSQLDRARDTIKRSVGDENRLREAVRQGRSVAIISTYRPPNRPLSSVLRLINSLKEAGAEVVLVDTTESPRPTEVEKLSKVSAMYIERENVGWDFSSWLGVIARYPWLETEGIRIILTNDSNFGPLFPIKKLFDRAAADLPTADVWGLTESHQHSPHLQSYFMVFEKSVLERGLLGDFSKSYQFPEDKEEIILLGEVALTNFLLKNGLKVRALLPYSKVIGEFVHNFESKLEGLVTHDPATAFRTSHGLLAESYGVNFLLNVRDDIRNGVPLNPTHHLWDIILSLGSPFIKRELVLKNPIPVPAVRESIRTLLPMSLLDEVDKELNPLSS